MLALWFASVKIKKLLTYLFHCVYRQLEEVEAMMMNDAASLHCFTTVENFDTDILSCLNDPKKALSYQTGTSCTST